MARVRVSTSQWGTSLLVFGLALLGLSIHAPKASAGVYRYAYNTVEQERRAECGVQPYTIYGITWINDTPRTSTSRDRWDEQISVAYNATTVDATLWSDAYNCKAADGGQPRDNAEIYDLRAASGGQVPITFPYGTSIFRGDSLPGQFTDPPGSLRVRLSIGTRGDGCYSVAYSGRYRDSRGAGASNTSYSTVCITRQARQDNSGGSSSTCPAQPGVNISNVPVSFGATEPSASRPSSPSEGTTYVTRTVTSSYVTWARDANTSQATSYTTNTVSFSGAVATAPYDRNTIEYGYKNNYYATTWTYTNGTWTSVSRDQAPSAEHTGTVSLGACYFRTFNIEPQGGSASFDDPEYPSSASILDTVKVTFGFDGPDPSIVRSPSCVGGIGTTVDAIVRHADGAPDGSYPYGMTSSSFPGRFCGSTAYPTSIGYGYPRATYRASIPNLRYGDQICYQLTTTPGSGEMDENGAIVSSQGFASDPTQTCSGHLAARPYLRVFGGDIAVGGGVQRTNGTNTAASCTGVAGSGISAWNRGLSGGYAGSGAQYAVQAFGAINGFASSLYNPGSNPLTRPPKGLTFANTGGSVFGGNFGTRPGCKDYVNNLPKDTQKFLTDHPITGLTLNNGDHTTYYVTGDVYITGDVKYGNSDTWTRPEDMPTFKLIVVGGNIYISPEVHQLDGLYVAEQNQTGAGGTIYTCADQYGPMADNDLFDDCASALVVNGSFVANQVKLLRTRGQDGTNYQSNRNETPANSRAAEIFNYTPEMWLAGPPNTYNSKYDSFTSLAPIL